MKDTDRATPSQQVPGGTPSGTPGYPIGQQGDAPGHPNRQPDDQRPWWAKAGYGSFEQYIQELDESREKHFRSSPRRGEVRDPAGGWHPALDIAFPPEIEGDARGRRQLGVKLSAADYRDLKTVADRFGLAPTTYARMLVIRGVRSSLQSLWEEDLD